MKNLSIDCTILLCWHKQISKFLILQMDKTDLWFIFYHFQYFQSFLLRQTRTCWPVRSHWSFLCINGHLILLVIFSLGSSLRLSQTDKQIKQSHRPFKWKFSTTTYNIWMPNPNHRIEGGGVGERAGGGKGRGKVKLSRVNFWKCYDGSLII